MFANRWRRAFITDRSKLCHCILKYQISRFFVLIAQRVLTMTALRKGIFFAIPVKEISLIDLTMLLFSMNPTDIFTSFYDSSKLKN